jgi:carboxymethylenebutenolidase
MVERKPELFLTGKGPGVLVLHAWWGLNGFVRGFCQCLAGEGFTVAAPDLYHGQVAASVEEAKHLRGTLKGPVVQKELLEGVTYLKAASSTALLGLVGFSLGGWWGLWLAMQPKVPIRKVVIYYAARGGDYAASAASYQFHLAESDVYTSASAIKTQMKCLKDAGRPAEFHTYPSTKHWFFESDRKDAYDAAAAGLAWERTIRFLKI